MREKKTIKLTVLHYIEIDTDLPVEEAMREFEKNSQVSFSNTDSVEVVDYEWMESNRISYMIHGKNKLLP